MISLTATMVQTTRLHYIAEREMSFVRPRPAVEFLNLGKQPLANKYPTEAQFETEEFFPLAVFFCPRCKNVQLGTMVSRERMFEDYYYLSSVNAGLGPHFETAREEAGWTPSSSSTSAPMTEFC